MSRLTSVRLKEQVDSKLCIFMERTLKGQTEAIEYLLERALDEEQEEYAYLVTLRGKKKAARFARMVRS